MNLESQVCSLDLAKRLKELGIKQDSYFYWDKGTIHSYEDVTGKNIYSAFTVSELGDFFQKEITSGKDFNARYFCRVVLSDYEDKIFLGDEHENEVNARAKMLIYLLENNLINLKKENEMNKALS